MKNHKIYLDILRIMAAFSVVMLHISSQYIVASVVNDSVFCVANFYDSINRFGVPIFVMISGALFLNPEKEISIKKIWLHNVLRIIIIYILWNYIYYVYQCVFVWKADFIHQSLKRTIIGIVYGTDHLWFLGMIIGLYIITPVLRTWLERAKKRDVEYLLLIFFIFSIFRFTATTLLGSSIVDKISNTFLLDIFSGYLGYYVFGYYLENYEIAKKIRIILYATIPVDIAANYMISYWQSEKLAQYNPGIYDCFGVFTFLEIITLFVLIKTLSEKISFSQRTRKIIKEIAGDTLGVYLMHMLIIDYLMRKGTFGTLVSPVIFEVLIAVGVFACCIVVAAILRRIPIIGRYIC